MIKFTKDRRERNYIQSTELGINPEPSGPGHNKPHTTLKIVANVTMHFISTLDFLCHEVGFSRETKLIEYTCAYSKRFILSN